MKSALIPTMGVTLYTNPPPPPKILKLVIGVRSGCTLTKEKPTGTSIFGYSCATEIRDDTNHNASIYRPDRLFIFQLLEYGDDQSSVSRRYFVFAAPCCHAKKLGDRRTALRPTRLAYGLLLHYKRGLTGTVIFDNSART